MSLGSLFPRNPGIAGSKRDAIGRFLDHLAAHLKSLTDPVVAVTEGVAFAVERLASDNQVEFVLNQRHRGGQSGSIVSDTALALGRSMLHRFDIDWERTVSMRRVWTS